MIELRGAHLYLDCYAGIAGDMTLAALIDLGVPEQVVRDAIAALGLPEIELATSRVRHGALVGLKVDVLHRGRVAGSAHGVVIPGSGNRGARHRTHAHRAYRDIRALVTARSTAEIARHALAIFDRIALAESRMHGVPLEEIAFHEVGAADSIADIVGCAAAFAWLAPSAVSCRVVPLGGGSVRTAHGVLPVPAPATLELLAGCSVEAGGDSEMTTPTGAALVAAAVSGFSSNRPSAARFGPMPTGRVLGVGWGAGTRDVPERPNLLRVVALEPLAAASTTVDLLEANIDDMSGELAAPLLEALLAAGALDAWLQPILMKKGRPALLVCALVPAASVSSVEEALFRESTTLGVRRSARTRTVLDRELVTVETALGLVEVKLAGRRNAAGVLTQIYTAMPELESCRKLAIAQNVPLRRVYELAAALAQGRWNLIS